MRVTEIANDNLPRLNQEKSLYEHLDFTAGDIEKNAEKIRRIMKNFEQKLKETAMTIEKTIGDN